MRLQSVGTIDTVLLIIFVRVYQDKPDQRDIYLQIKGAALSSYFFIVVEKEWNSKINTTHLPDRNIYNPLFLHYFYNSLILKLPLRLHSRSSFDSAQGPPRATVQAPLPIFDENSFPFFVSSFLFFVS